MTSGFTRIHLVREGAENAMRAMLGADVRGAGRFAGGMVMRRIHLASVALALIAVVCTSAAPATALSLPPDSYVSGAFSGVAVLNTAPGSTDSTRVTLRLMR